MNLSITLFAVRTADCLPILLINKNSNRVCAVHAGWRGLTAGILSKALSNIDTAQTVAAIGPAISREAFEVGPEVIDQLWQTSHLSDSEKAVVICKGARDRWHLDLQLCAVLQLLNLGLRSSHIEVLQICTKSTPQWHSYRREDQNVGSNWSWIRHP